MLQTDFAVCLRPGHVETPLWLGYDGNQDGVMVPVLNKYKPVLLIMNFVLNSITREKYCLYTVNVRRDLTSAALVLL